MIARHDVHTDKTDIWSRLAAPLPNGVISWRQDGKVIARDGKYFARFVAYIEANTVRERLDSVVPGEWDLTLELLPPLPAMDEGPDAAACSFKARLQILGVIREDVGTGRDYKAAATDAFKRAAVRFGVAHELYAYEQNWVQVDGDGRNAKPVEDPGVAYARRYGPTNGAELPAEGETQAPAVRTTSGSAKRSRATAAAQAVEAVETLEPLEPVETADPAAPDTSALANVSTQDLPSCPKCGGRVWDNRASKRNPKAPDYKCRDRSCDGVIWPPRAAGGPQSRVNAAANGTKGERPAKDAVLDASPLGASVDDIPF